MISFFHFFVLRFYSDIWSILDSWWFLRIFLQWLFQWINFTGRFMGNVFQRCKLSIQFRYKKRGIQLNSQCVLVYTIDKTYIYVVTVRADFPPSSWPEQFAENKRKMYEIAVFLETYEVLEARPCYWNASSWSRRLGGWPQREHRLARRTPTPPQRRRDGHGRVALPRITARAMRAAEDHDALSVAAVDTDIAELPPRGHRYSQVATSPMHRRH